jgi:hypothetical protein
MLIMGSKIKESVFRHLPRRVPRRCPHTFTARGCTVRRILSIELSINWDPLGNFGASSAKPGQTKPQVVPP